MTRWEVTVVPATEVDVDLRPGPVGGCPPRGVVVLALLAILLGGCVPSNEPGSSALTCERFIALWEPRLYDTPFVEDLEARDGYPREILDEGFHALDEPTQRRLVDCLVDELERQDPLPAGTTRSQAGEVRDLVFLLIFHKDQLPPVEVTDLSSVPTVEDTSPVVPPSVTRELEDLQPPSIPPPGGP